VYPIYWLVLTLVVVTGTQRDPWVIASNYLLFHLGNLEVDLNVAWTLFHETLFYAVFSLFLASRKLGLIALGIWCSLCVLMIFLHAPDGLREYLIAPVNVLFAFGMATAWLLRTRAIPRAGILTALGTITLIATIAFASLRFNMGSPIKYLAGIGAALLILGTARLEELGRLTVPHSLRFFGDASYSIYLIHLPFLTLIAPSVHQAWLRHPIPLALPFVALSILATAAGCAMHLWIERPLLKLLSRH
jgi:peptidoglycan/LPS O-acetylase OafA/YrhL